MTKSKAHAAVAIPVPPVLPPLPAQPAIVDVTLDPADFVDIIWTTNAPGDDRLCNAKVVLRMPAPLGITQAAPNDSLVIKAPMFIDFVMPGGLFKLAGIAFKLVRGSGSSNGNNNMPKDKIKIEEDPTTGATTIHIHDKWVDHGTPKTWVWDILLVVQNTSGAYGLIDPDIENQN